MLVLLPPSEGKAQPLDGGDRLDLAALSLPELAATREAVLDALVTLCAGDEDTAREVLGLSGTLRGEVTKNAGLRSAPTRPAAQIYTGVLYEALGLASLTTAARRRAERSLLVFSALWGAVRIGDPIPSYRCSGGVRLPGLGALGPYWRPALGEVMDEAAGDGLLLDLRSTAYAGMWKPKGDLARRTVTLRVLQSRWVNGVEKRSVVSHFNKATKGRIVRDLLIDGAQPDGPERLASDLRRLGYTVEDEATGPTRRLDVILAAG